MKILIEEHKYSASLVKETLEGLTSFRDNEGSVSIEYVGYYYNPALNDCVFILPKVLLDKKEEVFGHCKPEDIINLEENNKLEGGKKLKDEEKNFIYELAVWVYRAIVVYNEKKPQNTIVKRWNVSKMGHGRLHMCNTFLDIILAIQKFNRENQDFFFTILRNLHSGFNKINWTRTISHSQAIIQNSSPIYLDPVNKKRIINFDEELLVIFFSILNYIQDKYGFPVILNVNIPLITGKKFERYLNGMGVVRLRQIKYKYFSDKALYLWDLCYAFFEKSKKIKVETDDKEYLIVKDFNIVFEAIIDELIGAKEEDIPKGLKEQEDRKRVDHMFFDKGLIESNDPKPIYYIGDSKYYKRGTDLDKKSVYKQFTYAKNVIQWNLNLFLDEDENDQDLKDDKKKFKESGIVKKLRDDETEGYNIIPNFFISAKQDVLTMDSTITPTDKSKDQFLSRQFYNRLFDRDTLLTCHYDVNFLYVISLYGRNREGEKRRWGEDARRIFRAKIQEILDTHFQFHIMTPLEHIDGKEVLQQNFKEVIGKVFQPYPIGENGQHFYSLALEKPESIEDEKQRKAVKEENARVKDLLGQYFEIVECSIGEDKREDLPKYTPDGVIYAKAEDLVLLITKEGIHFDNAIQRLKETKKVGVALKMDGAVLQLVEGFTKAKYLIIHNKSDKYEVFGFDGKGPKLIPSSKAEPMVTTKKDEELYLVYDVDTTLRFYLGEIDLSVVIKGGEGYNPQLWPLEKLLKKDITDENS